MGALEGNPSEALRHQFDCGALSLCDFALCEFEIQTLRIATQPLPDYLNGKTRNEALADLKKIDEVVSAKSVTLSNGTGN